jgi:hypothetical protein
VDDAALLAAVAGARTAVLVEGESDAAAVSVLAGRLGRPLDALGAVVVPMDGITNVRRHLTALGGAAVRPLVLCDAGEEVVVRRALGLPASADAEEHGVFTCVVDLEDELVRAVGLEAVEAVIAAEGDLRPLRTLRRQPAQRGRPPEEQLHRFIGSISGRKLRYARLLAEAVPLASVPPPLARLVVAL